MKNLLVSVTLVLVSSITYATGVKQCAQSVKSTTGIHAVCVSDVGTPNERLYITSSWSIQTFKVEKTTGVNGGINPAYQTEVSQYLLLIPKTSVPVAAEVTKAYISGQLARITGSVGGVSDFNANTFTVIESK